MEIFVLFIFCVFYFRESTVRLVYCYWGSGLWRVRIHIFYEKFYFSLILGKRTVGAVVYCWGGLHRAEKRLC